MCIRDVRPQLDNILMADITAQKKKKDNYFELFNVESSHQYSL